MPDASDAPGLPDPSGPRGPAGAAGPTERICSARGCREPARWALRWNNPKLHPAERRKTWLACDQHREHLSGFLSARGFLREVEPLGPSHRVEG